MLLWVAGGGRVGWLGRVGEVGCVRVRGERLQHEQSRPRRVVVRACVAEARTDGELERVLVNVARGAPDLTWRSRVGAFATRARGADGGNDDQEFLTAGVLKDDFVFSNAVRSWNHAVSPCCDDERCSGLEDEGEEEHDHDDDDKELEEHERFALEDVTDGAVVVELSANDVGDEDKIEKSFTRALKNQIGAPHNLARATAGAAARLVALHVMSREHVLRHASKPAPAAVAAGIVATDYQQPERKPSGVKLQLRLIRGVPCSRFHVDHVPMRSIVALRGSGTIVLREQFISKRSAYAQFASSLQNPQSQEISYESMLDHLVGSSTASAIKCAPSSPDKQHDALYTPPPGAALFLRGARTAHSVHSAALHRSPFQYPHQLRILLQVDDND